MRWMTPLVLLIFAGCSFVTSPQQDLTKTSIYNPPPKEIKTQKSAKPTSYTGFIKGVIQSVKYDNLEGLWVYEVAGSDTTNAKLPYAVFKDSKKLYNEGAYIYAQIKQDRLVEIYQISNNQLLSPSLKESTPSKPLVKKRTKAKQKIAPPEVEVIVLD